MNFVRISQNAAPETMKNNDNEMPQLTKKSTGFCSAAGTWELKILSSNATGRSELITGMITARECDAWMALRVHIFMQRMQLSQLNFQKGLLSMILIEAVGHFSAHSLQVSQSVEAMNVFAKKNRPYMKYMNAIGARAMSIGSMIQTLGLEAIRPPSIFLQKSSTMARQRAQMAATVAGFNPGWIAIQLDGMSRGSRPLMRNPFTSKMSAGRIYAIPLTPGTNQLWIFMPALVFRRNTSHFSLPGNLKMNFSMNQGRPNPWVG